MNQNTIYSLLIVLVIAVVTIFTRFAPFMIFGKSDTVPPVIVYLGAAMPSAVIILLIVYCLRSVNILAYPFGIPEAIACVGTATLHAWKKNTLLSIGGGTVLYMWLVQFIF